MFFRASTREQAEALGLRGWVRNELDGTVRCVAEGAPDALARLEAWLRAGGPPAARVDAVEVHPEAAEAALTGFVVLR